MSDAEKQNQSGGEQNPPPAPPARDVTAEIVDDESSSTRFGRQSVHGGGVHQQTVYMEMRSTRGCGCCGCLGGCLLVVILLALLILPAGCVMGLA